ncbi:MAG: LPS export ABC transporter periplasmic protein LptC, partial [Pyrinomonadaceae bacterium]|nr:LPS export ABC transporter periplasmic protein LptC [Pyrinomonadaceae bacterium]
MRRKQPFAIGLRAWTPVIMRVLALTMFIAGLVFVGTSYYRLRNNKPFRMRSAQPELSREVKSVIEGFEHRVTEGDRLQILLRASREITYLDGRHELENVHLEVYPKIGNRPDQITADRAISDEEQQRIFFSGNVNIETRDRLITKTEAIVYDQRSELAEMSVPLTFQRENVRGRADGATLDAKNKKLELRGGVEIVVMPELRADAEQAKQESQEFPVTIRAPHANFDQATLYLAFTGGATAEQNRELMSGESLAAKLNEQKRVRQIEARGAAYMRTMTEGRAAEIASADMDFFFDDEQKLQRAVATRNIRARSLNSDSEWTLVASNTLVTSFVTQGERSLLREMRAEGRPVMTLAAPKSGANDSRAANKKLTADEVRLFWRATGRDLERAEAIGHAEAIVEPAQQTIAADRKTLHAPRFDCDFYESGNHARSFTATGGAEAIITPVQPTETRGTRTLAAQKMTTLFVRETQDIDRIDAEGDARFDEGDRHGQAANASYIASEGVVRLRGGSPVAWDSRARIKAQEIDSDTRRRISYARGQTATTYYSQEQTGGATPFQRVKSPVFIVAGQAEFQHETGIAIYRNDARAWQDDNFVRANTITLRRDAKRMEAEGDVESALYQAKRRDAQGDRQVVPVFATAKRMMYSDADRLLRYEQNVDIKQGTDLITGELANVYLTKDTNEVERTIVERSVVIQQPGRRATGDWAQYTAADETAVLTG